MSRFLPLSHFVFTMEEDRCDFESVDRLLAYEQRMLFQQATCNFSSLMLCCVIFSLREKE